MKLFGEKVVNSFTNSTYNILQVENFSEIFFDVYEVELNNGKFPVEKIAEYKGNPVVMLPIIVEGEERLYPFVLVNGKMSIIFHEKNTEIPVDNYIPEIITEEIEEEYIQESKQEILKQISEAKENAIKIASKLKRKKLQEANEDILEKKKVLGRTLEKAKNALVEEFFKVSNNIKNELISENDNRFEEINETIDNKISDLSNSLLDSLQEDFSKSSEVFDKNIKELVKESYIALQPKIDEELKNIATEIVEKVDSIEKNLEDKLSDKADKVLIENVEGELNSIALANIELNDKINKGVNKALSRVGNISTKVDELTIALAEEVDTKISKAEENIEQYYSEKLSMLEGKTFDLTENVRKSLVELISESKDNLIREIRKIQNEKPIEYVIESKGKRQVRDFDSFEKEYDKKIKDRVDNEVTRLRRYISVYSGGGSVAMQFADGGTMNGDLTVIGSISASQYLGLTIPDLDLSQYLPISGGTITGNLVVTDTISANRIYTTRLDALSANITIIDIKQYELSGFDVDGDVTINGSISSNHVAYIPQIQFSTTATPLPNAEGLLQWNSTDGTLDLGMDGGTITQQIGQELFTKVRNDSGYETISNGQVVYISGRNGIFPTVRKAKADSESTSRVLGVATNDIGSPDFGFVTTLGYVRGIKTNYTGTGIWGTTWVTGDLLYVSKTDAGVLTNVEPSAPHHSDTVGSVAVVSTGGSLNGSILVTLDRHKTLAELSDIDGTPLVSTGQIPVYHDGVNGYFDFDYNINDYLTEADYAEINRQGVVNRSETTFSFDGTNTFTLTPTGDTWSYYRKGIKYTITGAKSVIISGTPIAAGTWFIYIDSIDGTLIASQTVWTLTDTKVPIATINFNNSLTPKYWTSDERHSVAIDGYMQYYLHHVDGARSLSTPSLTGYTINTDTNVAKTFAISAGTLVDQDIVHSIASLPDPDGTATDYVVWYRTGASTWAWKFSNMPFLYNPITDWIQYDNNGTPTDLTGGSGAQTRWTNSYLLITNKSGASRFVIIPGRGSFTSLADAKAESVSTFTWDGFPIAESVIVYQLTWSTITSTTQGKCRLASTPNLVNISTVTNNSSGAGTDHNTLSNLQGGTLGEYYHLTSAEKSNIGEILGITKSLTYNGDGTVNVISTANGTKTMGYNPDGTLASITGTGIYKSKTFTYVDGVLTAITVI